MANQAIERLLKYQFADRGLLEEALTHKSWGGASYERLEFLGDRVLDLIVAGMLFERYPDQGEGTLAAKISVLVSRETLAKVARKLGLPDYLRTDSRQGSLTRQDSVVADCCEAVIGAIYLDGGLQSARDFVVALWAPLLETEPAIAKTELQEWLQGRGFPLPVYRVIKREGPDHEPIFTVELTVSRRKPVLAKGSTIRAAEQRAARDMLVQLSGAL